MILARYTEFRWFFAAPGATTAPDGLPAFPGPLLPDGSFDNTGATGLLRANGFAGTLSARTAGGYTFLSHGPNSLVDPTKIPSLDPFWPLDITCNNRAEDATYRVHEYDWWVSQRRDVGSYATGTGIVQWALPYFRVTMPDAGASGRIQIAPNLTAIAALLPGLSGAQLLTADSLALLFRNTHVYVRRRSDSAFQWAQIYASVP